MENLISYLSFIALILVVILLIWSLILTRRERAKKVTAKSRLANSQDKKAKKGKGMKKRSKHRYQLKT